MVCVFFVVFGWVLSVLLASSTLHLFIHVVCSVVV